MKANELAWNTITGKPETLPSPLRVEGREIHDPKHEDYAAAGYADLTDEQRADIAAAEQAAAAAAQAAHEAWLQTVEVYERVIEAPSVIVHSVSAAKGVGITATDDGELVPYIAHESPYNHAEAEARKLAAVDAANARKAQRATDATAAKGAGSAAASANSVPALRAEVARLAGIIERLCN